MEPGYPVWTVRPNWSQGVLERLEWLTDVMTAQSSGVEQRRACRLSPRRYVEITVNPTRQERSYLDLLLHRDGSETWLFPLWFDVAKLTAVASETDIRVEFDNAFREHGTGDFALLFKSAFQWEVISIAASDDTGLDLVDPLEADWPAGTVIFPLRLARLPIQTSLAALTSQVGEAVLMFQLAQENDFVEVEPTTLMFEGSPVLVTPPNRSQAITLDHLRLAMERDNSTGIPYRTDALDRAFQVQGHSWMVQGREANAEFRSLLYWLRGRQRALWLPSFNDDIITTDLTLEAAVNLDVEHIGYGYSGGGEVIDGRDVVIVNGVPGRITELGVAPSAEEERLRIGAGLAADIPAGATGSFMSKSRLNQDAIELMHHTDTDGVTEIAASFQSFADNRDPSGVIDYPIPAAEMTEEPCGQFANYTLYFSENLPYMTDGDTFNSGTVEHGNVTFQMNIFGVGFVNVEVSSVPRPANPDLNLGADEWQEHPSGTCSYRFDRDQLKLEVNLVEGYDLAGHLTFTQGRANTTDGEPWTCNKYENGTLVAWSSQSGPNVTAGSGFNGDPDFDDTIMFFYG
jgi:hypothetical protein